MWPVMCGLVEIVYHTDDGLSAFTNQLADQFHHLDLVCEIDEGDRFVKQQVRCFLRERHGDPCALPLAVGRLSIGPSRNSPMSVRDQFPRAGFITRGSLRSRTIISASGSVPPAAGLMRQSTRP